MGLDAYFYFSSGEKRQSFKQTYHNMTEVGYFRKNYFVDDWVHNNADYKDDQFEPTIDKNGWYVKLTIDDIFKLRKALIDSDVDGYDEQHTLSVLGDIIGKYYAVPDGIVNIYYCSDW